MRKGEKSAKEDTSHSDSIMEGAIGGVLGRVRKWRVRKVGVATLENTSRGAEYRKKGSGSRKKVKDHYIRATLKKKRVHI